MSSTNPLLQKSHLPQFNKIKPYHIKPAILHLLQHNRTTLTLLLNQPKFTWENLMTPMAVMHEELDHTWSTIRHLHAVVNSPALRKIYNTLLPKINEYFAQLKHNPRLYQTIKTLQHNSRLNQIQRKILNDYARDFRLHGIELKNSEKKRLLLLQNKLITLTAKFANNVLDATAHWNYLAQHDEIAGIPAHDLALAKNQARLHKKTGWLFTLDAPSYLAVITYATNRKLRQKIYTAYVTRASELGSTKHNNHQVIQHILKTRLQIAKFLGFANYAALSLTTKMLKKPATALTFLNRLARATLKQANQEYTELHQFALKLDGIKKLQPWDIAYYSEKLRQTKYKIAQKELRVYFPIDQVFSGMFAIAKRLFGVTLKEQKKFARWHRDVRLFKIYNPSKKLLGELYADLYARKNKQSGAWMDRCRNRMRLNDKTLQLPVAYLTCNFTPPLKQQALLTHEEVITLFHEFGHCLQHLLTQIDYPEVSGINGIPYDAIELASQLMENWCWEKAGLKLLSRHYKNHQPLPNILAQRLCASQKFQIGIRTSRQLEFALFDLILHLEFNPKIKNQVQKILAAVRHKIRIIPVAPFDRMPYSFLHIFADDYAAGYYSYKWSEVLALDIFAYFKAHGILDRTTGKKFLHTFLERGGSIDPMELFIAFRGRKPQVKSLLKHCGLVKKEILNFKF